MTHPKRPRAPNQLAKAMIDIATGEKPNSDPTPEEQGKDPRCGGVRADGLGLIVSTGVKFLGFCNSLSFVFSK